ncbi:hypothetical protein [Myxococcus eversor]|uniref:hypothetical protein n=1 Tax=Myxococcus eversor TaxID=2709661 RepID=UPI0013D86606|nr:hypothetical protein [Myxococcus eversor]
MKLCLLLSLSLLAACSDSAIGAETSCAAETTREQEAKAKVRKATEQSTKAHAADPASADAERAHAAVMAAFAEQSAAVKALTECRAQP